MSKNILIDELTNFGLSYLEAKVYTYLNEGGRISANKVAKGTGIVRSEVYRIANSLIEKRIVNEYLGRPKLFEAILPDSMFDFLIEDYEKKLEIMKKKRTELSKWLLLLRNKGITEQPNEYFQLIKGLPNIIEKCRELFIMAKNEIFAIADKFSLIKHIQTSDIETFLKKAGEKGVKIKVLTEVNESNLKILRQVEKYCEVRHSEDITFQAIVVDRKIVLTGVTLQFSSGFHEKTDILTNNQEFINSYISNFNKLWDNSTNIGNNV